MSLHYLLDGYNIIHQMPSSDAQRLEDRRHQLVRFIELRRPQGSSRNPVTIVFDGKAGHWSGPDASGVKVVFTEGEIADTRIVRMVSQAPNKKSVVVVTDDREVQYAARALGAQVSGVQEFLGRVLKSSAKMRGGPPSTSLAKGGKKESGSSQDRGSQEKYISQTLAHTITSEFEKIWLNPKR